jgi:hypothetical protein
MISQSTVTVFGKIVNLAFFLKAVPFYWDKRGQQLRTTKSIVALCQCWYNIFFQFGQLAFVVEKAVWLIMHKVPEDPVILVLMIIYIVGLLIILTITIWYHVQGDRIVALFNRAMKYFSKIGRMCKKDGSLGKDKQLGTVTITLKGALVIVMIQPVVLSALCGVMLLPKQRHAYLTSSILSFTSDPPPLFVILEGLVQLRILLGEAAICLVGVATVVIYVSGVLFVLDEARYD